MVQELLKTGKHTVTAISRIGSQTVLPKGVEVAAVDYDSEESLVKALTGQQFLIISLALQAPPDTQAKLVNAAGKAGVSWIMPNGYGNDPTNESIITDSLTKKSLHDGIKLVEDNGVSSWVMMVSQFWYEYSLTVGDMAWGFDFNKRKVTFFDDGETKINTTTWQQCGRAAAALVSLKVLPEDENDKSITLSHWRNKPLFIASFLISQRDMLNSVERVMGTTDADWEISYEPSKARWERGRKAMSPSDRTGFVTQLYARGHFPNGDANLEKMHGLASDLLGLPKEDLDEATKRAVDMWKSGYNAFGRKY